MNISSCQASSHNRAYNIYVVCCDDAKNVASLLPFQSPCTYSLNHLDEVPVLFQAPERYLPTYVVDVLWGQPIKQNQVASTSELHEH